MTTELEDFKKWWTDNCKRVVNDYGFDSFQEDVMFEAWQARGRLEAERIAELEAWKNEAIKVETEWDTQATGKALNIPLGRSVRANILPKIEALTLQVQVLREALFSVRDGAIGLYGDDLTTCNKALNSTPNPDKWIKRSDLERVGVVPDHVGGFDQLFRVKGEKV